jgi:hypothetical protein
MAGLLDNNIFSNMSAWDKAKTLATGYGGAFLNSVLNRDEAAAHGAYPTQLSQSLISKNPEVGFQRYDRTPLDAAINYGGAYQYAASPNVSYQDADTRAKAYQLTDYLYGAMMSNPQRQIDAVRDYEENLAGIKQAIADKKVNSVMNEDKIRQMSAKYGKQKATARPQY